MRIRLSVEPGDSIEECVARAIGVARFTQVAAEFVFNNVHVLAGPNDNTQEVIRRYQRESSGLL